MVEEEEEGGEEEKKRMKNRKGFNNFCMLFIVAVYFTYFNSFIMYI